MDNKKKKVIINSTLASVLTLSSVIGATVSLSSCNVSISSGSQKPNEKPQYPTKNPGFSNFIEDISRNDASILEEVAKKPLVPKETIVKPQGSNDNFKYSKAYILTTKEYKDKVKKATNRMHEIAQHLVIDKINSVFVNGSDEFKTYANIETRADNYIISYQLSKKPIDEEETPVEQLKTIKNSEKKEEQKLLPFFAFKYNFNFKNITFDIDNNGFMIIKGVKIDGEYDMNGIVHDLPSEMLIEINEQPQLLNTQYQNLDYTKNPYEKIEEWNNDKVNNQSFLNLVLENIRNSAKQKISNLQWMGQWLFNILENLYKNEPLKTFLSNTKDINIKALEKVDINPALATLIKDLYNPNLKYGSASKKGTLRYDIDQLGKAGIINTLIASSINIILGMFPQQKHPFDEILELPNRLSDMGPEAVEKKIKSIPIFGKEIINALKPKAQQIQKIFSLVMSIVNLCPNSKIADMPILEFITNKSIQQILWTELKNKIDPIPKDDFNAKKWKGFKKTMESINVDTDTLKGIITDFTSLGYEAHVDWLTKRLIIDWTKRMSLGDFFKNHTSFNIVEPEIIKPNSDGKTFTINAKYRLNFNKTVYIEMKQKHNFFNDLVIQSVLDMIGDKSDPNIWMSMLKVGGFFPPYLTFSQGDYIEFKIDDKNATIIPTTDGYTIKAKQTRQMNFSNTVEEVFENFTLGVPLKKNKEKVRKMLAPFKTTFKEYYVQTNTPVNLFDSIKDENSVIKVDKFIFDGNKIDDSTGNINKIKDEILKPYIQSNINSINSTLNFVNDIENSTKDKILIQLGIDPKVYRDKSKFILKMSPSFSTKSTKNSPPKMNAISLDISFNVPILKKGGLTKKWINQITIQNILY